MSMPIAPSPYARAQLSVVPRPAHRIEHRPRRAGRVGACHGQGDVEHGPGQPFVRLAPVALDGDQIAAVDQRFVDRHRLQELRCRPAVAEQRGRGRQLADHLGQRIDGPPCRKTQQLRPPAPQPLDVTDGDRNRSCEPARRRLLVRADRGITEDQAQLGRCHFEQRAGEDPVEVGFQVQRVALLGVGRGRGLDGCSLLPTGLRQDGPQLVHL